MKFGLVFEWKRAKEWARWCGNCVRGVQVPENTSLHHHHWNSWRCWSWCCVEILMSRWATKLLNNNDSKYHKDSDLRGARPNGDCRKDTQWKDSSYRALEEVPQSVPTILPLRSEELNIKQSSSSMSVREAWPQKPIQIGIANPNRHSQSKSE